MYITVWYITDVYNGMAAIMNVIGLTLKHGLAYAISRHAKGSTGLREIRIFGARFIGNAMCLR